MNAKKLTPEEKAALSPAEYRLMARRGEWPIDEIPRLCCEGYSQHALVIIPQDYAFEFLTFCVRNPRACYVSDICEPGSPHPMLLATDADVRTDCNRYRVYKDGEIIDEPTDVMKYWRDDLASFLLPCSFGFEGVLRKYNVKFRYMGAFTTNLRPVPAGRFRPEHMVATCRLFKTRRDAIRAIQITSRLPVSHGDPIHIGDPAYIGIKDITRPDIWPCLPVSPPEPNEVMLYWACAMTPEYAIKAAKPPLAIMHYPAMVFISDHLTEEFAYTEEIGSNLV